MMLELTDDEARCVAENLRRTVHSATSKAENAGPEVGGHLSRVARTLGGVLERLDRHQFATPAPAAATYWIMLGTDRTSAVLTHRAEEREGLELDGATVADSARFDTLEQAVGWFERWSAAHLVQR